VNQDQRLGPDRDMRRAPAKPARRQRPRMRGVPGWAWRGDGVD